MPRNTVEVFTAGCVICNNAIAEIKKIVTSEDKLVVHNLNDGYESDECKVRALELGIKTVPAVAVNGSLLECCVRGGIHLDLLRSRIS